jgi:hypothetical protein
MVMESSLGLDLGHAELRTMIKRLLKSVEASADKTPAD